MERAMMGPEIDKSALIIVPQFPLIAS